MVGAAGAAALAMIMAPRGTKRGADGVVRGSVGGDGDGPGRISVTQGYIRNFPTDASMVKAGRKGATWIGKYNDPRKRQDQIIWARHLVVKLQDLTNLAITGSSALSTIFSEPIYNVGHLKVVAMTGEALQTNNGGGTNLGVGSILQGITGQAVDATDAGGNDLNAFATIELPVYNTRYRLRNTSNRDAQVRLYEFTCKRSCNGSLTPVDMWQDALNQQKVNTTISAAVATAVTDTDPGTWAQANTNMHLTTTPYKVPFGYSEFWTLTNTVKVQLHPGKQLMYNTMCARKSIDLKLLNQYLETNGETGNIAGYTKYILVIVIGDRITHNGASDITKAGDFGFSDTQIAMDKEEQFVTSTVWAVRPKTIYLHNTADSKVAGVYYHGVVTADQGGTASSVQAVRPDYDGTKN